MEAPLFTKTQLDEAEGLQLSLGDPQAQHLFRFCTSGVGGGGGVQMAPGRQILQALLVQESRSPHTQRTLSLPPVKKNCSAG